MGGFWIWGMSMPKKSLDDMLSENTERPEVKGNAKRQAVFLAYWDEIESAYKKGWSYMDIWQALNREGIFDFGYSTFMHYKDKRKRRIREVEREQSRNVAKKVEPEGGPAEPKRQPIPRVPGSTKVEMPTFGTPGVVRDDRRF